MQHELMELDSRRNIVIDEIHQLKKTRNISASHCEFNEHERISLFMSLFKGRTDVYPRRFESKKTGKSGYQPACANEWLPGICKKPKIKCGNCPSRKLLPVTEQVLRSHLVGVDEKGNDFIIGIYPLLDDETCWFLAVDFDKKNWSNDVSAFISTCNKLNIPAAVERSRSGNGAHVWIFFSEPVPAARARQMGGFILTETMENRPELGFDSYDRFFPNQDTLPKGGFGNLIALPLQAKPRKSGNSVFLDEQFIPYENQWEYLSGIRRMSLSEVQKLADEAIKNNRVTGVVQIEDNDDEPPWEQPPSRKRKEKPLNITLPSKLDIVIENQIYFRKDQLVSPLKNRLLRLAAFQNPEFYKTQAMRMPVYNKPRIISCSEDFPDYIGLPRGCAADIAGLLIGLKLPYQVVDKRTSGISHDLSFTGELREDQQYAASALIPYDIGVLSASTAFGKTVVAAYLIAWRKVNTLVLVHRVQLIEQWKSRLQTFLNIKPEKIGVIGGGKHKPGKIIDIATIQSLCKKHVVDDLVGNYGQVIVDECHHLSAFSFELVAKQCKARYFLGLSATLTRKDGHHPIIFMQCGPIRYRVNDRKQAMERPFHHRVIVRKTPTLLPELSVDSQLPIHQVYELLMNDKKRNDLIVDDVLKAIRAKRSPVIITERKDHLEYLAERFEEKVDNLIILKGGMRRKEYRMAMEHLQNVSGEEERLILTTGRYLGEGFDDARLDTLFLTLPISWKGTL
ncbi:MAG: DEAD/DEAH box helicase family protein, partial [Victivallaceae bacterium]